MVSQSADLTLIVSDEQIRELIDRALAKQPRAMLPAAAGVLYMRHDGCVLLVQPHAKPYWDIPGGIVEPGESPRTAARREVKEELGCGALPVGELLVVDYLPSIDGRRAGMRYVFGCMWNAPGDGYPFQLQFSELKTWAWCTPEEQRERQENAPILARRVAAARAAIHGRRTVYLENGFEVGP